jgi:hypothetical protein
MDPGTIFVLKDHTRLGAKNNPYVAVFSCPKCGLIGLITRRQLCSKERVIRGNDTCSAEYHLDGENIIFRPPQ